MSEKELGPTGPKLGWETRRGDDGGDGDYGGDLSRLSRSPDRWRTGLVRAEDLSRPCLESSLRIPGSMKYEV